MIHPTDKKQRIEQTKKREHKKKEFSEIKTNKLKRLIREALKDQETKDALRNTRDPGLQEQFGSLD